MFADALTIDKSRHFPGVFKWEETRSLKGTHFLLVRDQSKLLQLAVDIITKLIYKDNYRFNTQLVYRVHCQNGDVIGKGNYAIMLTLDNY